MITQAAQDAGLFGEGFGAGTILIIVGMVLSVAVVSGLGFIARMNDRSAERSSAPVQDAHRPRTAPGDQVTGDGE